MYKKGLKGWIKHGDFVVLDLICLQISFVVSYFIYNGVQNPFAVAIYRNMAITLIFLDVAVLFIHETYKDVLKRGYYKEFVSTIKQAFLLGVTSLIYLFAIKESDNYSRITFFLMLICYAASSYVVRMVRKIQLAKKKTAEGETSLVIITDKKAVKKVVENVRSTSFGRFKITGLVMIDEDMTGHEILGVPVISNLEHAHEFIVREWIDEVLIADSHDVACPPELIDGIIESGITLHQYLAQKSETSSEKKFVENMGKYSVLTTSINTMTLKQAFLKRTMDILGGIAGCMITGLIFVVVAPIIYISSPGPIFFAQTRIGKNGKKFKMYKFRSMYMDAEKRKADLMKENRVKDGMMFKLDFDPRVIGNKILPDGRKKTGIGQFIRDTSLDEFPQFWNVLTGSMSLCGTRPPTVDEWEKYELHHRARLAIKPGVTGMWQVSGRSDITDFEEVVKLDREYITNWSVGLDLRLLFKTVAVVFKKDGSM